MMKMSTPFTAGKMPHLWVLSMLFLLPLSGLAQPYNGPCNALLYDFGMSQGNIVPCGPSANTTSQVAIDGQGTHDPTGSNITLGDLDCAGSVPGDGGSPDHVLWVTFVIQEGGSFEWQTVPGPDDYTYILYYSGDPLGLGDELIPSGCDNLIEADCGNEFTGWKVETTPDPTKRWRFYLVFYLRNGDQTGSGVVKIRKSCGLACEGQEPAVDIQVDCDNTSYTLTATPGFANYVWSDATNGVLAETSNVLTGAFQGETYTVVAFDDNSCPGSASVTVPSASCCEAEAGTVTNNSTGPFNACTGNDLPVIFSASGQNVSLAYAFLLVDASGNIIAFNTDGNFGPIANAGTYTVYGLSFDETLNGQTVAAYLGTVSTIAEIEASMLCLDLVSGAPGDNVITVKDPSCGTFPN